MEYYALETFRNYMGTGLIVIWFLLSLLYLFIYEKRKPRRILFVYTPAITLLLFFNPVFSGLFCTYMGKEIYFRTCWVLPVIMEIAYCTTEIAGKLQGKKRISFAAVSLLLIMVSGKLVYSSPLYSRAENIYHVPESVVYICDAIRVPGREVMAVFPEEMLLYVRQYSPYVCMPYGREVIMGEYNEFHEIMEADMVVLDSLVKLARQEECHYIILRRETEVEGNPADYNLTVFAETDGYIVYRDNAVELIVP